MQGALGHSCEYQTVLIFPPRVDTHFFGNREVTVDLTPLRGDARGKKNETYLRKCKERRVPSLKGRPDSVPGSSVRRDTRYHPLRDYAVHG